MSGSRPRRTSACAATYPPRGRGDVRLEATAHIRVRSHLPTTGPIKGGEVSLEVGDVSNSEEESAR